MVDPLQLALAPIATKATTEAITAVFGKPDSNQPQIEIDEVIAIRDDESNEPLGIVTHAQMVDIEAFLSTSEVASLFQSWGVLELLNNSEDTNDSLYDRMSKVFEDAADQWCTKSGESWGTHATEVWRLCANTISSITFGLQNLTLATIADDEIFERNTTGSQLLRGKRSPVPFFIQRLLDTLSTPARINAVRTAIHNIRMSCREDFAELQMNHVQDDYRFEVDKLYVDRTLSLRSNGHSYSAEHVLSGLARRVRIVVIGDPGVGKSTLVRHTMHRIAKQESFNLAPILIEAREYAGQAWGTRFTEYLAGRQGASQSLPIDEDTLIDSLSLGTAYVIFDGVDEIIDTQKRREFIRQVESFCRSFPLIPVLATSRKVGYNRASFQSEVFYTFELAEFTTSQFLEYTTKWFKAIKRDDSERESFIRESVAVSDIRFNPLMLSLLCTLYRARGHIPRNRRSVYRECAELLFQRWDSMRHVEQPYDHRHYGEKLMQELARFFYKSQSVQAGIEEGQLERVVAAFFQDTASVEPPEHMARARQFLDFCADRAWLLTVKGSNARGVRLFSFTHRTFMEYLAAEALARNARNLEVITDEIVQIFEADPSSVLPDVLVQCVDDKFDRGAENILKDMLQRGRNAPYGDKYLSLCLRIVNSSPMSRAISVPLPGQVQSYWRRSDSVEFTLESSRALFEIYRDPRNRILRSFTEDAGKHHQLTALDFDAEEFSISVCQRWARFAFLDQDHYFENDWSTGLSDEFEKHARNLANRQPPRFRQDGILTDYLIDIGKFSIREISTTESIVPRIWVHPFLTLRAGSVTRSLIRVVLNNNIREHDTGLLEWFARSMPLTVTASEASVIEKVATIASRQAGSMTNQELLAMLGENKAAYNILIWLAAVSWEITAPSLTEFHTTFDSVVGATLFERLTFAREVRYENEPPKRGTFLSKKSVSDEVRAVNAPTWLAHWVNEPRSFVVPDPLTPEEEEEEDDDEHDPSQTYDEWHVD